jgi:putative ABC transport system permease protein
MPAKGQAWVDPSLLEALGAEAGDTLLLGDSALRITELIALSPTAAPAS